MERIGVALHVEDGAPELGADGVHRFERIVFEDFFTDFIPQVFLRIELRRIRRKIQEHDVVGNDKVAAAVVGGTVENQQNVLASKLARQHVEEDLEACCIAKLRKSLALSDGLDTCATENALVGWGGRI